MSFKVLHCDVKQEFPIMFPGKTPVLKTPVLLFQFYSRLDRLKLLGKKFH